MTLKMQGAWGAKDIFNDMAMEYVDRVNAMSGGRLKIDYLVSGAVVKAFQLQDAARLEEATTRRRLAGDYVAACGLGGVFHQLLLRAHCKGIFWVGLPTGPPLTPSGVSRRGPREDAGAATRCSAEPRV